MLASMARRRPPWRRSIKRRREGWTGWSILSYIDATNVLPQAVAHNVAHVPGEGFYVGGEGKNYVRLNFSFAEPDGHMVRHRISGCGQRLAKQARPEGHITKVWNEAPVRVSEVTLIRVPYELTKTKWSRRGSNR